MNYYYNGHNHGRNKKKSLPCSLQCTDITFQRSSAAGRREHREIKTVILEGMFNSNIVIHFLKMNFGELD